MGIYDKLSSEYLFLRTDYGISKKLTLSIAAGYHLNKNLSYEGKDTSASSSGMGDIIIFPRYDIYNETKGNIRSEITLGLGVKLPIGSHDEINSNSRSLTPEYLPPTIQLSTGGTDIMLYAFFLREYKKQTGNHISVVTLERFKSAKFFDNNPVMKTFCGYKYANVSLKI